MATKRKKSKKGTASSDAPAKPSKKKARPEELQSEPPPSMDEFDEEEDAYDDEEDFDDEGDLDDEGDFDDDETAPDSEAGEDGPDEDDDDEEWEDDDEAAAQMGHQRYVIAGFFASWMVGAYILGRTIELGWSKAAAKDWFVRAVPQLAAVPHEEGLISRASVSLVLGALIGGAVTYWYYIKPSVRTWADEVADELGHVKWPDKKEISNSTVVCIAASTVLTVFLMLLDRLWGFVTNLIYTAGI